MIELIAFSDYLCPWCYNASVRLRSVAAELEGRVTLTFQSFLLRPKPEARDLEAFRSYTRSWMRPASEDDAPSFTIWATDEGPPSHSLPPHQLAKAAAEIGGEAFFAVHERLLSAYFTDNRDISDESVLREVWTAAGLPDDRAQRYRAPELRERVLAEHDQAVRLGVTGVPSVMLAHQRIPILGAQPAHVYRRWLERALAGEI